VTAGPNQNKQAEVLHGYFAIGQTKTDRISVTFTVNSTARSKA